MKPIRKFAGYCPKTQQPVTLATRDWYVGLDERIHFAADCTCGNRHYGSEIKPELLELSQAQ